MADRRKRKPRSHGNGPGSVYKRKSDKRWTAALTIDGKRLTVYGKTQDEATAKLTTIRQARDAGTLAASRNPQTIAEFAGEWLRSIRPNVRATTYLRYEQYLRIQIAPRLGGQKLSALTPLHIMRLYEELRATLAPTTLHHLHEMLHAMLKQAVDWDLIPRNPAERVATPRKQTAKRNPLRPEELAQLFAIARGHRLEGIVVLAATNGLREGELAGLRWEDVDLDRGLLVIRQQMARAERGYEARETKSSGSQRMGRLSRFAIDALRRRLTIQKAERLAAGGSWVDTGLVFTRPTGERVTQNHLVRDVLAPLLVQAGLPPVTLHDLRHSFATIGLRQGIPLKIMSDALGHASIGMTANLYMAVQEDMQAPIAAAFDTIFGAK